MARARSPRLRPPGECLGRAPPPRRPLNPRSDHADPPDRRDRRDWPGRARAPPPGPGPEPEPEPGPGPGPEPGPVPIGPARRLREIEAGVGGIAPDPEEALLEGAVAGQLAGRDDLADPAVDHDRDVVGDGRRDPDVLLDEEDGDVALGREGREQRLQLGDDEGGEPLGRLVEHEEARVLEEGARDGEHLLLAARELPAAVAPPLREPRKHLVHPFHGPRAAAPAGEAQVLFHGKGRPQPASLGGVGDPPRGHPVGGEAGDVAALEPDRAAPHREEPHDRVAKGGLAHAVAPDHRMDPFVQGEVDALQGMGLVVMHVQVADLQGDRRSGPAARAFGPPAGRGTGTGTGSRSGSGSGLLSHGRAPGTAPAPPGRSRSRPGSLP